MTNKNPATPPLSSTEETDDCSIQPILDNIGRNMRIERQRRGLSVNMMTAPLGMAESYIRMLENGSRTPSLPVLLRISDFFGCTLDELISAEGKLCRSQAHSKGSGALALGDARASSLSAAQEEVFSLVTSLNADELAFVADCLRSLLVTLRK